MYGALIQALKETTKSNLLSTPSIVTMDNEEAYIVVGENVPFVTGSVSTGNGTVNPYTTIERKDVRVTLKVVPHIGENGTVRLEVEQEVSGVKSSKVRRRTWSPANAQLKPQFWPSMVRLLS